jgi:hypothetical protein
MSAENQDVLQASETTLEKEVVVDSPSINDEIKRQLDMSFFDQLPAERQKELIGDEQPKPEDNQVQDEAAKDTPTEQTQFNEIEYLKKFGFQSEDDFKQRLAEYEALKSKPETPAEVAYANEQSKKIAQYLKEGKLKEVKQYLDGQELLASIETMSDEQKLKTHIKMSFPKFSQQMVDHEYNKRYAIKDADDYDDPIEYEMEKLKVEQRLEEDARKAVEAFSQYKEKIELPDIQTSQPAVDSEYEAYKAANAKALEDYQNAVVPAVNALKESDLGVNLKINDPNNQLSFDVAVSVEKADLEAAKAAALDYGEYMQKTFYTKDGQIDAARFAKAILRDMRFESYLQSAARQGAMAERKRAIEKEIPDTFQQREALVVDDSNKPEWMKQMDAVLSPFKR